MKLYLAGPMRGVPLFNFPAFDAAAAWLKSAGHEVYNPAERDRAEDHFDPATDKPRALGWYMAHDLPAVCRAEAIAVLPGWEQSQGAQLEVHVARELGLPILDAETLFPVDAAATVRTFPTGATRNADADKPDYEGFLSPLVLRRFAAYMHAHRRQADGKLRDSDNWQRGIPKQQYLKSAMRHLMDWWALSRGVKGEATQDVQEALCALMFNVHGALFEELKGDR